MFVAFISPFFKRDKTPKNEVDRRGEEFAKVLQLSIGIDDFWHYIAYLGVLIHIESEFF